MRSREGEEPTRFGYVEPRGIQQQEPLDQNLGRDLLIVLGTMTAFGSVVSGIDYLDSRSRPDYYMPSLESDSSQLTEKMPIPGVDERPLIVGDAVKLRSKDGTVDVASRDKPIDVFGLGEENDKHLRLGPFTHAEAKLGATIVFNVDGDSYNIKIAQGNDSRFKNTAARSVYGPDGKGGYTKAPNTINPNQIIAAVDYRPLTKK